MVEAEVVVTDNATGGCGGIGIGDDDIGDGVVVVAPCGEDNGGCVGEHGGGDADGDIEEEEVVVVVDGSNDCAVVADEHDMAQ